MGKNSIVFPQFNSFFFFGFQGIDKKKKFSHFPHKCSPSFSFSFLFFCFLTISLARFGFTSPFFVFLCSHFFCALLWYIRFIPFFRLDFMTLTTFRRFVYFFYNSYLLVSCHNIYSHVRIDTILTDCESFSNRLQIAIAVLIFLFNFRANNVFETE